MAYNFSKWAAYHSFTNYLSFTMNPSEALYDNEGTSFVPPVVDVNVINVDDPNAFTVLDHFTFLCSFKSNTVRDTPSIVLLVTLWEFRIFFTRRFVVSRKHLMEERG